MSTLSYFLKTSLFLLLFYSCYALLLRRNTFFGLNRAYLLGSIVLSLFLPFVELPTETVKPLPFSIITLPTVVVSPAIATAYTLSLADWLCIIYGLGMAVMLGRLLFNVWAVFRRIRSGTAEQRTGYTLIQLQDDTSPSFSFGNYMVLNQTDALHQPNALLRHEEAHIRQRHTLDILFLEVIQLVFWFNPVLIYYKRALQEVHEFLADRAVLKTPQADYPRQLVAYALNVTPSALITPFVSKSTLKQRIIMLQKPASHRRTLLGYILVLPLAACLVMCTQSEKDQPENEAGRARAASSVKVVNVQGKIYDLVEEAPTFPGGMKKLGEYLGEHLKYPKAAEKANAEGTVFVNFILTKDGEITDAKSLKTVGFGMDEEAVRVVSQMPRWIPARHSGKAVNVRYNLPIRFQLEDNKSAANDFWKSISNHKNLTLDNQLINIETLKNIAVEAQSGGQHISFTTNKQTSTVSFHHVD